MNEKRRMAPDYRKVLYAEHASDWSIEVVEAGPHAVVSAGVWFDQDGVVLTASDLRLFAATLQAAAAVLARTEGDAS